MMQGMCQKICTLYGTNLSRHSLRWEKLSSGRRSRRPLAASIGEVEGAQRQTARDGGELVAHADSIGAESLDENTAHRWHERRPAGEEHAVDRAGLERGRRHQ